MAFVRAIAWALFRLIEWLPLTLQAQCKRNTARSACASPMTSRRTAQNGPHRMVRGSGRSLETLTAHFFPDTRLKETTRRVLWSVPDRSGKNFLCLLFARGESRDGQGCASAKSPCGWIHLPVGILHPWSLVKRLPDSAR